MNKLLAAAAVSLLIFSSVGGIVFTSDHSADAGGSGHMDEVPPGWTGIYTAGDLAEIMSDGAYPLSGKYIQMADIVLSGEHVHIGYPGPPNGFTGEYDGNGYHIKGMNITATYDSGSSSRAGLFGSVRGARIANVTILDMFMDISRTVIAGGIAGEAIDSEIVGCSVSGSINVSSGNGNSTVGGIVGYLYNSTVSRCANLSDIYTNSISSYTIHAGGIVGNMRSSTAVSDCYNAGSVRVTGSASAATGSAGIACRSYSESASLYPKVISNCYNVGVITFSARPVESAAIFAVNSADIVSSYALEGSASILHGGGAQADPYTSFKTDGELKDRYTFAGWNFGLRWMMKEGGYPVLVTRSNIFNPVSDVTLAVDTHYRFVLTDIADITVAYTGPDWLSLSADNVLSGAPSAVGIYTVTVSADNPDLGTETATWIITVVPGPQPPSVTLIKRQLTSDTFIFSVSAYGYDNLFWSLSDGTVVPPGTLQLRHTFKSGVTAVTVVASNAYWSDSDTVGISLYDRTPAGVGYTSAEYIFAPDIGDAVPTLTVKDRSGNPSTVLAWDNVRRAVTGTFASSAAGKTFDCTLTYGDREIEWNVQVLRSTATVPTASFTYAVSDRTVFFTSVSNVELGSSLYEWSVRSLSGALVFRSYDENPIFDAPSYSMYFATLIIMNQKGEASSSQSVIVSAPAVVDPSPDPDGGGNDPLKDILPDDVPVTYVIGALALLCIAVGAIAAYGHGNKGGRKRRK